METVKDVNPFVAVVAKKQRALKKKLEKIAKFEGQLAAGKVLDEEQLALVHSKSLLERSLHDVAAIKEQLDEVAKEQEALSVVPATAAAAAAAEELVTELHTHTHTVVTTEERRTEVERQQDEKETPLLLQDTAQAAQEEETLAVKIVHSVVQTTTETDVDEVVVTSPVHHVDVKAEQEKVIHKLLKALHVYYKYADSTGRALPDDFDYFAKTLLGVTFLSSFGAALEGSRRAALNYVNGDLTEVCRGISYQEMSSFVDALAEEMDGSSPSLLRASATTAAPVPVAEEEQEPLSFGAADLHAHASTASLHERDTLSFGYVESIASFSLPAVASAEEQAQQQDTETPAPEEEEETVVVVSTTTTTVVVNESPAEEGESAPQTAEGEKKKRVRQRREREPKEKSAEEREGETKRPREKREWKKRDGKKDEVAADATAADAAAEPAVPKKKSFLDSVKAGLPVEEKTVPAKKDEEKPVKKEGHKNKKNTTPREKKTERTETAENAENTAAPVAEGEREKRERKPRGERKPREERAATTEAATATEGEGEQKEKREQRKREFKPKREKEAKEETVPAAPAVFLDDGFQQPRKHVESAAKKAKKEAEQQAKKVHYQKKEGSKSPVPAASK